MLTDSDLLQQNIRYIHTICPACPSTSDVGPKLCGVNFRDVCRDVRRVEKEDINGVAEARLK